MDQDVLAVKSDEELVSLILKDKGFFGELIDRYQTKLARYIARLGRFSKEDIEDILQNVFVKVYENINSFSGDLKFSSWIYRIAHNETISEYRRSRSRPEGHYVEVEETKLDQLFVDMDFRVPHESMEASSIINDAMNMLNDRQKEILILRYFEDKSYDEISDILKSPPGSVAVGIKRAKEKLGEVLKNNGYEYGER